MATKTLTAHCYCKAVHYSVTLPESSLPLPVRLCHCSICRYTHGTLNVFHADLPRDVKPEFIAPSTQSNLTGYKHASAASERLFCSTCGCHIGDVGLEGEDKGQWVVATSIFEDHGEDLFQITTHCFTESAPSGLYSWLAKVGDREMKIWNPPPGSKQWPVVKEPAPPQEHDAAGNEILRAQCHCGGVSFTIPRPDSVPGIRDDPFMSKFVSRIEPSKWVACLDLCDDCRLVDGTHTLAWTFVPRAHVQPPMPVGLVPYGTMKAFDSSPGVRRGFCGTCGATVIFSCDDRRPADHREVVDVAVGILRAPEGPLAEEWLTWRAGRMGPESGRQYDRAFYESLQQGLENWGKEKYGGEAPAFIIDD
ncbi:DUF636 domain protein [Pleurostoma richardsiae]|uniref:DUF636 domain protein n=1 Tax=Pleurostoma richardsiae TaxID=41990 RepID=A0AA38RGC8_9PEZI|nr:DUF636 domain protein [Pleurostoma richardsiae]